ncbi:YlbF family regulator [Latilactobacillus fuchuensis]|uniref:YlbF family regulator n=1 Tax=Latilactobacillus fuchuensis TaxID=164393 RepID=UPI0020C78CF5|nr:YlbF family regulator [Latilactobacillus fuchuensis]MCP8857769.1 YlbF family regulator [Latilactobacillus fuchuensis]
MTEEKMLALEPTIVAELDRLTTLIQANQTVQRFQAIEQTVKQHPEIAQLQTDIEAAQKEAVQAVHYNKPNAARVDNQVADQLNQQLADNPLVQEYRAALYEANATLEYMTTYLQSQIDGLDE